MKVRKRKRRNAKGRKSPKRKNCLLSLRIVFRASALKAGLNTAPTCGGLAQLGERLPCKQEVSGSSPLISTTWVASSAG